MTKLVECEYCHRELSKRALGVHLCTGKFDAILQEEIDRQGLNTTAAEMKKSWASLVKNGYN